ncbi:hypothetical protein EDB86DRAFT_2829167 [Lactarius hatsudake]|nr:hypothetical protein EDB86DRAFT_2829167 [Lactarius hatsudake]
MPAHDVAPAALEAWNDRFFRSGLLLYASDVMKGVPECKRRRSRCSAVVIEHVDPAAVPYPRSLVFATERDSSHPIFGLKFLDMQQQRLVVYRTETLDRNQEDVIHALQCLSLLVIFRYFPLGQSFVRGVVGGVIGLVVGTRRTIDSTEGSGSSLLSWVGDLVFGRSAESMTKRAQAIAPEASTASINQGRS